MADLPSYANSERNIDHVLVSLKKGTQLIKYSRKGKPKFCLFRLSADETTLIWYSHGQERNLKLSLVSKIIVGQRTAVFRRYLRPEKDYLSFSLIYNNGDRSLDLICKDQEETEVWLTGLKSLTSKGQLSRRIKSDFYDLNDGADISYGHLWLDQSSSRVSVDLNPCSDVGSEHAAMQSRTSPADGFRLSVSSTAPSCTSTGSGQDDIESLGDVYVWGELWSDGSSTDSSITPFSSKIDILIPKPLETNVVLDVHQIACGVHHVALVNRQGEVFTWGEESGGRLGHGIEKDFSQPHLVEFLAVTNVDFVACGEYHTCAISTFGDLYTWGDGIYNAGILGHETDASHWLPKRVCGPLEGIQVTSIACGTWHSAIITSMGKLLTFGDGKFGVLGHGDRENVLRPKEVQQLNGLRTMKVACGVWHTAAIVEVMSPAGPNATMPSRMLFTWGDGDKYRLGHGNKEAHLTPTCVSALIDYSFHQIACGHTMTIALTTSGHIFTMGSNAYGQLGNAHSDGKVPCLVQDKLVGEFVEEITCGAYHVAVLTSRGEVFTWGKGANGRLGHGNIEDHKSPTLVEALRDKLVKSIACGANFTSSICIHKWVSGTDQSVCSGCRQAFGFTRKRHNCYNCGLVHCHACSSKKALRAALAPTPGKPHRVCDACYNKLKSAGVGYGPTLSKKVTAPRRSVDSSRDRLDKDLLKSSRIVPSLNTEQIKYHDVKSHKSGSRHESVSALRASQASSFKQLKDVVGFPNPSPFSALKPIAIPPTASTSSRSSSPISRRSSSPAPATPVISRGFVDSLKKSNGVLSQEVTKLQNQIKSLRQKNKAQEEEIQKLQENQAESAKLASEHSSKCREAREVVESLTTQLKEIAENLPPDVCKRDIFKAMQNEAKSFLQGSKTEVDDSQPSMLKEMQSNQQDAETTSEQNYKNANNSDISRVRVTRDSSEASTTEYRETPHFHGGERSEASTTECRETPHFHGGERHIHSPRVHSDKAREVTEQFESGVYVTVLQLSNGSKIFKRVRFSKRKFSEHQAEEWWKGNRDRVLKRYSTTTTLPTPISGSPAEDGMTPTPPIDRSNETITHA